MTRRTVLSVLCGGLSWTALACGPVEPSGTPGALKEGGFTYCEDVARGCSPEATIPDHIAVGVTFGVGYSESDVTLSSADETALEVFPAASASNGRTDFRGLRAGGASVEARADSDGALIDFVMLDLGDVDTLSIRVCDRSFNAITTSDTEFDSSRCIERSEAGAHVDISQGASLAPTVCAIAVDAAGNDLAGRLPCEWSIDESSTAELELIVASDTRCAAIGGLTTGAASVTISGGDTSAVLDVTVKP